MDSVENTGTELDARYSDEGATATSWDEGRRTLADAPLYWITTVRPDGRPHMTPLLAVWQGDAMYFCTGPEERKGQNLAANASCILSTGTNALEGLDIVVEGDAERVADDGALRELAAAWEAKYGPDWHFEVHDGAFHHGPGEAHVFRLAPVTAFGFAKGRYGQTRWTFGGG